MAQLIFFKRISDSSGLKRRFPIPLISKDRYLPKFAALPFREKNPEFFPAKESRTTALLFTGCVANYIFTGIAEKAVKVLNALGINVRVPVGQACCGTIAQAGGDFESALILARRNLAALCSRSGADDIVVLCASGGYMLKKRYRELFEEDSHWSAMAEQVARRTYDISEYLIDKVGEATIARHMKRSWTDTLTYHDPCHLKRAQGVSAQPRALLTLSAGEQFVEMDKADTCCGSGGLYGLTHEKPSEKILARKIRRIHRIAPGGVATGCPACMIQLLDGIERRKCATQVFHTIEVLWRCLE